MRMNLDMARIDHEPFKIRLINHCFQHFLPNSFVSPATEAPLNRIPMTVFRRQVSPWRTRPQNPEHAVQKLSRILRVAAPCPFVAYGIWLEQFPHCIGHIMPSIALSHDYTSFVVFSFFILYHLSYLLSTVSRVSILAHTCETSHRRFPCNFIVKCYLLSANL